jgi:hypothetical protein
VEVTVNPYGSYRRLRDNAVAAMVAAIEIYNKPRFAYRDECAVILLVNAWGLLFKAALSKHRISIYYPKKPGEDYRTVGLTDAVRRLNQNSRWPASLASSQAAMVLNIEHLTEIRNNAVHFYNSPDFSVVVHALAQQSVINFRDFLHAVFGKELADEITWSLMPLGVTPPVDPINYLRKQKAGKLRVAVREMLDKIEGSAKFVSGVSGADPGRLMTHLPVQVVSVKKAKDAEVVVGVEGAGDASDVARTIIRRVDPNLSHPLTATQVVEEVGTIHGRTFTNHTLYAVAHAHDLRSNPTFYYKPRTGSGQWSRETVTHIRNLPEADIDAALATYRSHLRGGK